VLPFFASLPKCVVAMEACASAHHWGREIGALGHEVRLIAPAYVKPFVKRQKNDAADAEAIAEAASRATMRFVPVKSAAKQGACMVFKARDLLVRQRTQTVNALRGHLAEYGVIAPQGLAHLSRLVTAMDDAKGKLPAVVIVLCAMLIEHIACLDRQIAILDKELRNRARQDELAKRLMTIPGVGAICATALQALAPPAEVFAKGRDFAAWLGLTPKQASSGGKTSAEHRRWGSVICVGCSLLAPWRSCAGRLIEALQPAHGWRGCWRGNHACWSPSHWRTGLRGSLGR
jgi:transposase